MRTETLHWHELPDDGMPDADSTVMLDIAYDDGEALTWPGWWDGTHWRDASTGDIVRGKVAGWSDMPAGAAGVVVAVVGG